MTTRGFSLLELVAVLAIFSMIALAGVQVIQASVTTSNRLTEVSETSQELAVALAVLRQDLNAAVPRPFTTPTGNVEPSITARNERFALSVGGLLRLDPGASGFGRVVWRHDRSTGAVTRAVWTSLTPGAATAQEEVVLTGVSAFALHSFRAQGGWRPGYSNNPRAPDALPLGLKVVLTHDRAGAVETMVSLR